MTVKELREKLSEFPDDLDVLTKKTELCGNVGMIFNVFESTYGFLVKMCNVFFYLMGYLKKEIIN